MPKVRLHKFLAASGVASRRKAEALITTGVVSVNGVSVTAVGTSVDPESDVVLVKGKRVRLATPKLFLFHKPRGVITSMSDPQGRPTVAQFFSELPGRFYPVGRLDYDVVGLLLVTNDGDLAHRMLHPRFGTARRYLALVDEAPSAETVARLKSGVRLGDSLRKASEVVVLKHDRRAEKLFPGNIPSHKAALAKGAVIELVVHEGEKHFVKRLLARVGHPVRALARIAFGPYSLGTLRPGELREAKLL